MRVICTVVIILASGYHVVDRLHGRVVKERDNLNPNMHVLYVDFSKELKTRGYKLDPTYTFVQKVNENSCIMDVRHD